MTREYLELIIKASLDAGSEILKVYTRDDFNVTEKADTSPLTDADLNSHNVIMEALKETGIPVLSEEGADIPYEERKDWRRLWIVDPLDGTKEFVKRGGDFTVNIALVEDNFTVMGVVYAPWLGYLYWGSPDGSFFFDTGRNPENVDVSSVIAGGDKLPYELPDKFTVVASKSHFSEETKQFIDKVRAKTGEVEFSSIGSSLKMCLVAAGKAHLYPRLGPTMEWDTAAGQAVVENAGGSFIDLVTGQRMKYNRENLLNNYFLVSAKDIDLKEFI